MNEKAPTKDYALITALEALTWARMHSDGPVKDICDVAINMIKLIFKEQE